ncbi:MAG TPA: hypothetical protein PLO51_04180 [Candidatus Micrarchaeota archaeon]|nr:hypothetical protein [Candidatus Micrarchaeota archaeon]
MAGNFLQSPKIIAWAKENLYQAFGSALIVIGFFILISIAFPLSNKMFCTSSDPAYCDHLYKANEYASMVQWTMLSNFISLNVFNIVLSVYGSLQINIRPGGFGISFSIAPLFRPIMDGMGLIMNFLVGAWGEWAAQVFLLDFISKQMLAIFLPLGVFLRAFPFTRSAGGAIIALAIGLYFVYPVCLIANKAIADAHYGSYMDQNGNLNCHITPVTPCFYDIQIKQSIKDFASSMGVIAGGIGGASLFTYLVGIKSYGLLALAGPAFSAAILVALGMILYNFVFQLSYIILIMSLILPIFNLFILMTSIREIAKFLGSDLNISALLRLI